MSTLHVFQQRSWYQLQLQSMHCTTEQATQSRYLQSHPRWFVSANWIHWGNNAGRPQGRCIFPPWLHIESGVTQVASQCTALYLVQPGEKKPLFPGHHWKRCDCSDSAYNSIWPHTTICSSQTCILSKNLTRNKLLVWTYLSC